MGLAFRSWMGDSLRHHMGNKEPPAGMLQQGLGSAPPTSPGGDPPGLEHHWVPSEVPWVAPAWRPSRAQPGRPGHGHSQYEEVTSATASRSPLAGSPL